MTDLKKRIAALSESINIEEDESIKEELSSRLEKFKQLHDLKEQLDVHEADLKMRYLCKVKERNVYFEKVREIENYCLDNEDQEDSVLEAVGEILGGGNKERSDESI